MCIVKDELLHHLHDDLHLVLVELVFLLPENDLVEVENYFHQIRLELFIYNKQV